MKKNRLYSLLLIACFIGYCWLFFVNFIAVKIHEVDFTVCLFKRITTLPCASCGTTRAVNQFFNGEILASLYLNPFGVLVVGIMIICPVWIVYDFFKKTQTFYDFYRKAETKIRTRKTAILIILLVLFNWIWNLYKHI